MKFFSDIKPIIKAQGGTQLPSTTNDTLNNIEVTGQNSSTTSQQSTTNISASEAPKVKIYQAPNGIEWAPAFTPQEETFFKSKNWSLVNTMTKGDYDAKGMGGYDAKNKYKGTTSYDTSGNLGDKKPNQDNKNLTFSDLRALNATAANKIERVPQSMPVGQMTRVDPLGRSQAIDKQKADAQANANAARVQGPQNADPTLNVLQNLGLTEQTNKATQQANMMQGENLSNQRDRQRQQVENANLIEVNNQNTRIGLRNAQETEMAQKKTQQRVTNAQIGNTWLGEKELEQKQGIMSDTQLVERYAQLAISKDPRFIEISKARAEITPKHLEAESNLKTAKYNLAVIESKLDGLELDDPAYASLQQKQKDAQAEVKTFETTFAPLKTKYEALKAKTEALQNEYELKLIEYQRNVNKSSNQVGGDNTEQSFKTILDPFFNPKQTTTPTLKKGGGMTMADRLYLEDVRQMNRIELQRQKQMNASFVLPEPKAYYHTMKMMMQQNKAVTDMVKDIYKTIYGGNKKR
jgi:hypothetical protein